jgi:Flp pilus assembly protein TadG
MRNRIRYLLEWARTEIAGASAIEFAIVAPVFFMLIFGIVVYGYYFATLSLVNHIAYEAARATISGLDDGERSILAQARADELITSLQSFLGANTVDVAVGPGSDGIYTVTVHHHFDLLDLIGGSSILPLPPADQTATVEISHGGY